MEEWEQAGAVRLALRRIPSPAAASANLTIFLNEWTELSNSFTAQTMKK